MKEAACVVCRAARIRKDAGIMMKMALKDMLTEGSAEMCFELGEYFHERGDDSEASLWYYNAMHELNCDMLVCGVERDGNLIIPDGSFIMRGGDAVTFLATPTNSMDFFKKIGVDTHKVKNCMIIGGGKTSYYLGKQLISSGVEVKILELDEKRCEELSVLLPKSPCARKTRTARTK